jgi:DNA processing protein
VLEDLRGLAGSREAGGRRQESESRARPSSVPPVPSVPEPPPPPPTLDPAQQRVFDALAERRHADELARALDLPVGDLARLLMQLEMKKAVRRLPGNFYERR